MSDVGTVGTVLCGANPPTTPSSDPLAGYNSSTSTQRRFGNTAAAGNGADCTTTATGVGQFGDRKALDTWTYYPSPDQTASFSIDATPAAPTAGNDTGATPANTELIVPGCAGPPATGLLANDTGTNVTVTSHTTPGHGTVTTTANGTWDYTPTTDYSGPDSFQYTITDGAGQTATATVNVTITPTAGNDTDRTTANSPTTTNVLANDHGSTLTVAAGPQAPAHGSIVVNPNKSITYTPAAGYAGRDTYSYTATDASNQTATATVTVDVAPLVLDDTATTTAIAPKPIDVLVNDVGTGKTVTAVSTPTANGGTVVITGGGTGVTYTPNPAGTFSGTDTFTYTVTANGETGTGTVTVTVTPVAVQDARTTPVNTAVTLDPTANDKGTNKSLGTVGTPSHGGVTVNGNNVTYTPTAGYVGTDSFTYTLNGNGGSDASGVVTITIKPRSPDDAYSMNAGGTLAPPTRAAGVLGNDTPATGLTAAVNTPPTHGSLTLRPDGTFTYTPTDPDFSGSDSFTYVASGNGASGDPATVTITVLPTALPQNYGAIADQQLVVGTAQGVLNGSHGTGLSVGPATITTTAGGTVHMHPDGSFTYDPPAHVSGTDSFSYTITDASGNTITQTAQVVVAPDAIDDGPVSIRNGGAVTVSVLVNDVGTNKRVTSVVDGSHGTVTTNGTTVTYTPSPGYSGPDSFTYTLTADGGTDTATVTVGVGPQAVDDGPIGVSAGSSVSIPVVANDQGSNLTVSAVGPGPGHGTATIDPGGQSVTYTPTNTSTVHYSGDDTFTYTLTGTGGTDTATVTIRVNPQAVTDSGAVDSGDTLTVLAADGVLANDLATNPTVTAHTDPSHGRLTIDPDGGYVYKPTFVTGNHYAGPDSFTYTLRDAAGRTSTAVVNLTVRPIAPDDGYTTDANTTLTTTTADGVLANDSGNTHVTGHTDPTNGRLTAFNDADGSFTYVPDNNFSGTDTFTYDSEDSSGTPAPRATVTITVRPVGEADPYPGVAGTDLVVSSPAAGVLGNDHGTSLTATPGTTATTQNGSVTMAADGTFTYTPPTHFSGTDTFTCVAHDPAGQSYTQTATVVVAPKAVGDALTVASGTTTPTSVSVLANDDGSGLVVSLGGASASVHGGAISTNGTTVSYTPPAGFSGNDSFDYTVTDSHGQTATATVNVTVNPTAANESVSTPIGTPITVDELANDHVSSPTVTVTTPPTHGGYVIESNKRITYSPGAGFSGADTIGYTVTDPDHHSATATITITVTPTAVDDTISTSANVAATKNVVANDGGTALQVTSTTTPGHGSVTVSTDRKSVTYTPTAEFSGNDTFDYTVSDGTTSRTATVHVTVLPTGADDTGTTAVNTTLTVPARGCWSTTTAR